MVENVPRIGEIGEIYCAKTEQFERVEMGLAMAESDEMSLKLFEVIKVVAFVED